ncbi:hypothetical protein [Nocardioides panacis]|uniref:hypothetical protein n=1 Tax=Nocardioides panacis TaxID=2849501 RepID=UPI00345EB326
MGCPVGPCRVDPSARRLALTTCRSSRPTVACPPARRGASSTRHPPRGLVIDGFGLGHVPTAVRAVLIDLVAADVVVAVSTRVPHGGTWAVYGGLGGGTDLADLGVVGAGALSAAKTRLLLLACLASRDQTSARQLFLEGVAVLGRGADGPAR